MYTKGYRYFHIIILLASSEKKTFCLQGPFLALPLKKRYYENGVILTFRKSTGTSRQIRNASFSQDMILDIVIPKKSEPRLKHSRETNLGVEK